MRVRTNVKAGKIGGLNHNESLMRVRTHVKAGRIALNHNESLVSSR